MATSEAETHGDEVASAGKAVTMFAQKLKIAQRGAAAPGRATTTAARRERLPCHLKIEIAARMAPHAGLRDFAGRHPDLRRRMPAGCRCTQALTATLDGVGACRLRIIEQSKAGARAQFVSPDAELAEKIEDKLWAIHEENTEAVTRAHGGGRRADQDLRERGRRAARSRSTTSSTRTTSKSPAPIRCNTAPDISTGPTAPCRRSRKRFCAKDPRMAFCAMVDRNGYLPVHNKIYSHPQRPGDVAWNTANSRNRRIFNDPPGLAAAATSAVSDPELCARHGQRHHRDDARDRRPDPRSGPALGRISHGLQAMTLTNRQILGRWMGMPRRPELRLTTEVALRTPPDAASG